MTADTRKHRNIPCLIAGGAMLLTVGLIYGWSIFRSPLTAMFPSWQPTRISVTFTVSMVCFSLGGILGGKLSGFIKTRFILLIAAGAFLIGFCGLSFLIDPARPEASLLRLYVLYGVFCGAGVGLTYNATLNTVVRWFPGRTGAVSGALLMCFGLGGLALGSVVTPLVGAVGLRRAFLALGLGVAAVLVTGSFIVKAPGAGSEKSPERGGSPRGDESGIRDYSTGEMLRSAVFWLYCLWHVAVVTGGLLIVNSAAVIAVAFNTAAGAGLLVSVFNGIGRVAVGALFDKRGRHVAMSVNSFILLGAGILLMAGAALRAPPMVILGMFLTGISFGGGPASTSALVNTYFGQKHYAMNLSVATASSIPGSILGPLLSSRLQELSGGSYGTTFVMLTAVAVAAIAVNTALRLAALKARMETRGRRVPGA
ncbi:MAG: MFS transporter [Spirochaetaceae bacterium]|jgi:OFA family oxalate/formate antiporter-like MFS transporter|nr:MFS transporter [Spirochaetaceae bacterium]